MKGLILLIAILTLNASAFSQKVIKRVTQEICKCINKIDPELTDPILLEKEFEQCIGVIMYHTGDLKKKGYDIMEEDGMSKAMDKIMVLALEECPGIVRIATTIEKPPQVEYDTSILLDPSQCQVFHSGKFLHVSEYDSTLYTMNGDSQISLDLKTNTTSEFNVEWLNECEYVLTYKSGGTDELKEFYKASKECRCSIVAVEEERVVTACEVMDVEISFEMKILE